MDNSENNNGKGVIIQIFNYLKAFCLVPDTWDGVGLTVFKTMEFNQSFYNVVIIFNVCL